LRGALEEKVLNWEEFGQRGENGKSKIVASEEKNERNNWCWD